MGYFMRFLATDGERLGAEDVERALKQVDGRYELRQPELASETLSDLYFDGGLYAQLDINHVEDDIVREELAQLTERLAGREGPAADRVRDTLAGTRMVVAAEVLFQHRDTEETLKRIDPLWQWLFERRTGLLQVDGKGFYDGDELILAEGG